MPATSSSSLVRRCVGFRRGRIWTDGDCGRHQHSCAAGDSASSRFPGNERRHWNTALDRRKSPVARYQQMMAVRGQQLTQEVNNVIADARRKGMEDPDSAIVELKRMDGAVSVASDVEPQVRDQLLKPLDEYDP